MNENYHLPNLRVLDLADASASFCSRLLADLGARVTKIESPSGDPARNYRPIYKEDGLGAKSLFFHYHNQGKRSVTLNLRKPEGRDLLRRLAGKYQVIIETFRPGYLKNIGLGFKRLQKINPALIMVSLTGYGQSGPQSGRKACALTSAAAGGQMHICGSPNGPPLEAFGAQPHYIGSLFAAVAVLLAARQASQTGQGAHIDLSQQEAVASTLDHVLVRYFFDGQTAQRQGDRHWNDAFKILTAKDGHIMASPFMAWPTVVDWMAGQGLQGDLADEKWDDENYRQRHAEQVFCTMGKWSKTQSAGELFQTAQLMRLPWAPVCGLKDVTQSPQLKDRGFFRPAAGDPSARPRQDMRPPWIFSDSAPNAAKKAPELGQHNQEVFQRELGLSPGEIKKLRQKNVI